MKKIAPIFLLGGLAVMTTASIVVGSLAWFSAKARITDTNDPIAAVTNGAYFAYGNGTAERPYGITKPRHLYNLAWLQYLNYFNKNVDDSGQIIPTYFELGSDVDGEGMVIPPIGNESRPFVGNFDGQGFVISNFVISNNASDFVVKPSAITSYTPTEIVGLFSVVGKLASDTTTSYDTSVNAIYDTGISGLTIKSNTAHTLAGIVAGYVNGTISKVAVSDSTINIGQSGASAVAGIGTSNLSDYSLVGYCTEQYKNTLTSVKDTVYDITMLNNVEFNAAESSDDQGWGGSINMLDMFNRLYNIEQVATNANQVYKTITNYDPDGNIMGTPTTSEYAYNRYHGRPAIGNFSSINRGNNYIYLQGGERKVENHYSYYEHTGYPITDGTNYLCYDGDGLINVTGSSAADKCTLWKFQASSSQYYIYTEYEEQTIYLCFDNGSLSTRTTRNNTCLWSTIVSGDYKAFVYSAATADYVLDIIDGTWCLTNPDDNDPYYIVRDGSGHYIGPNDGNYATSVSRGEAVKFRYSTTAHGYYDISNTSNYLGYYYRNSFWLGTARYPVTVSSTTSAYYRLVGNNGNLTGNLTGTGYLRAFSQSSDSAYTDTIYVQYNANQSNSPWYYATNRNNGTSMTIEEVTPAAFTLKTLNTSEITDPPHEGPDSYEDSTRKVSKMDYTATNTTYFPLNVNTDGGVYSNTQTATNRINNGNYDPKDSNTGYVISGSNIGENTTITNGGPSLIRVSKYGIDDISNSYENSDGGLIDSKIYTHNQEGNRITIASDSYVYQKYADSKKTLYDNVLKDASNVYGLHFMSSQISKSDVVNASDVSILGTNYGTYQLPVNSIDFNLKEQGYINFFSGTYFSSTVTSFFSLHKVMRNDSDEIIDIKEIEAVYGNTSKKNYSYAYKFTDGTYSKPYRFDGSKKKYEMSSDDSGTVPYVENDYLTASAFNTYISSYGYSPIFNVSRITNINNGSTINTLVQNALYYFEIPMNSGEFCLGSVDGGTGGYLIYLDIGANATKTQRSSVIEHFINETKVFEYPLGVALLPTNQAGANTFDDTNSVCVAIYAAYSGDLSIERTNNDVEVSRTNTTNAKPTYASEEVTALHNPGGTSILPEVVPKSSTTTEVLRMQYYDYNVTLGEVVRTVITDTKVNSGSFNRTVQQFTLVNDEWVEREREDIAIYSSETGVKLDLDDVEDRTSGAIEFDSTTTTVLLEIKYVSTDDIDNVTEELELVLKIDSTITTGTYFVYDNYVFHVDNTGEDITITVVSKGSKKIYINGTEVTSAGQTIVVSAS